MQLFYQCEHCEYYIQHYNISKGRIWKVCCGHCKYRDKEIKPSLRDCKYFKPIVKKQQNKYKEQYALEVLKEVEKTLKGLKLYLNKNKDNQKLDDCLIENEKT